jgi:RNA methyltransferase, TrmH family
MNHLASLQDAHVKKLRLLKNQDGPFAPTHFLVEGQHLINHALAAGVLESVYLTDMTVNYPNEIKIFTCDQHVLEAISNQKTPQGMIGLCRKIKRVIPLTNTIVYLDQINDPGNVGTILRTALGLGISTVIFSPKTANRYQPKVIASSQGALFGLNLFEDDEDARLLKEYQQEGYHVVITNLSATAVPLNQYRFREKNVIVIGNESHGVSPKITALSNGQLTIPMKNIDSLNVAIAFAIIAYRCVQYQPAS